MIRPCLVGKRIVVDPGHGGKYMGAIGVTGAVEKDVNLSIARQVADDLRKMGAWVRMTRHSDRTVGPPADTLDQDLQARVDVANQWPADLFVSIHSNSETGHSREGMETYHCQRKDPESLRLASDIMADMSASLPVSVRGVKPANFYVIKNTSMPAALVEVAYLSNPTDEAKLKDPAFRKEAAQAIAQGIGDWFDGVNAPPQGDPTPDPPQ